VAPPKNQDDLAAAQGEPAALPPLPELPPYRYCDGRYNDEDMRAYAALYAALMLETAARLLEQVDDAQ
jgi:hypothetical protein